MASYRHLLRTCVMQTLFAVEFRDNDPKLLLEEILQEFAPKISDKEFAYKTLEGTISHQQEIAELISKFAPDWPFENIARVDRAILEIGIYEIVFSGDVPPVVAINEAVEIAKHFGDMNSSKFINGVLSSIMKDYNRHNEIPKT